jgi:hypothetical protein
VVEAVEAVAVVAAVVVAAVAVEAAVAGAGRKASAQNRTLTVAFGWV